MSYTVSIIEDDELFAKLQFDEINKISGFTCNAYYLDPVEFLSSGFEPDIILLDLLMPKMNGLEAIPLIIKKYPNVSIVINSIKDESDVILEALKEGAVGYVDKQHFFEYISIVLNAVSNDGAYMTPKIARKVFAHFKGINDKFMVLSNREKDIAHGIVEGLSYKLIADRYKISIDTVRMNIRNIYRKYKINSKSELISIVSGLKQSRPKL